MSVTDKVLYTFHLMQHTVLIGPSNSLCHRLLMLYEAISSLWPLPLSNHIIISSFCGIINVTCFFLVYPSLGFLKP